MSEEKDQQATAQTPSDLDWYLQDIVRFANSEDDFELSVTLLVEGLTLSGDIIGGKGYYRRLQAELSAAMPDEADADAISKYLTSSLAIYEQQPEQENEAPEFIHLKDAQVFAAGQQPLPSNGMLWRGRISSISGFSLGTLR